MVATTRDYFNNYIGQPKVAKRLCVNYTNPIFSQICIEIWGCRMIRGGVKVIDRWEIGETT